MVFVTFIVVVITNVNGDIYVWFVRFSVCQQRRGWRDGGDISGAKEERWLSMFCLENKLGLPIRPGKNVSVPRVTLDSFFYLQLS